MDIVERLRKSANIVYKQDGYTFFLGLQNEAADEIERLRKENQRQKEHIMLLNAMIQTEHNIIRVVDLKEGE